MVSFFFPATLQKNTKEEETWVRVADVYELVCCPPEI